MSSPHMPVSKATNAYELLDEIKALGLAEPLRISMDTWLEREADVEVADDIRLFPECGTVGCIGGWTESLIGNGTAARNVLGLSPEQCHELFYDVHLCNEGVHAGQTRAHAERVAAHITAFQAKYEAQLKATVVRA